MAFSLREDLGAPNHWDTGSQAVSTCSNAEIFHRINAILGNSLDLSGVCTTPNTNRTSGHHCAELSDMDRSTMSSNHPHSLSKSQESSPLGLGSDLANVAWLGMGVQALSLNDRKNSWENSLKFGKQSIPPGFPIYEPLGNCPGHVLGAGNNHVGGSTILDSRSSSPTDSETSALSSGSEHLYDLLSTLQISHPAPLMMTEGQRDLHRRAPLTASCFSQWPPRSPLPPELNQQLPAGGPLGTRWPQASMWPKWDLPEDLVQRPLSIESEARLHRQSAALNSATLTWSGQLPPKKYSNAKYSCKVFLGGLPWDVTEAMLISTFSVYGHLSIEWPGKDAKHPRCPPKGYVYLMFVDERSVPALLRICSPGPFHPDDSREYYFKMSSRKMRFKDVQVIPWVLADSNFARCPSQRLVPNKTVFVGALHGMLNAEALALIMNDLFGGVIYAGIDTDRHKYPIGSGRVTFNNQSSYLKAIDTAFVEIKTPKFTKKVQIDPYLEDCVCQVCSSQPGPFFCRDPACFKYYCRTCWYYQHSMDVLCSHRPIMKNQKILNCS